jgi:hypothetical protein
MFEVLLGAKALNEAERDEKAITRGEMVARVLPNLPDPEHFAEQDDPQLAQAVWDKISQDLWNMCLPSAGSAMQRLIGRNMGNGYLLCRTHVTRDQTEAVYVTDDRRCIETDFVQPALSKLARMHRALMADAELLIDRQPGNARQYARRYSSTLKQLTAAANGQLALAIESASQNGSEPSGDDED